MNTIKGSNETSIYIIDDNYRIVHYNSTLQEKFPELQCGDLCYEKLCQESRPCEECPFSKRDGSAVVFYNKVDVYKRQALCTVWMFWERHSP